MQSQLMHSVGTGALVNKEYVASPLFVGDLHPDVDEDLLNELFTQVGPVTSVHIVREAKPSVIIPEGMMKYSYAFIHFKTDADVDYAMNVMKGVALYGIYMRLNKSDKEARVDIGANLFIGNIASHVSEKTLLDTFSKFGPISECKILRDPTTLESKNAAFLKYDSFDCSDAAIETMNGQPFCGTEIRVEYSFKQDGSNLTKGSRARERHGSAAERQLAALNPRTKMASQFNRIMTANAPQQQQHHHHQHHQQQQQQQQQQQPIPQFFQPQMPAFIYPPQQQYNPNYQLK